MEEKYGFVYIWFDCSRKMYYIGSHWGKEDDGYICSSNWMRNSYQRRPQNFRRKIIETISSNRSDTYFAEQKWLNKIKDEELGKKYYNKTKILTVGNVAWNKGKKLSEEHRQKLSESHKGKPSGNKGNKYSEDSRKKISQNKKGFEPWNKGISCSTDTKAKISEGMKLYNQKNGSVWIGKKHSNESRKKMSEAAKCRVSVKYKE